MEVRFTPQMYIDHYVSQRGITVEDVPEDEALEELLDEMDEGFPDDDEYMAEVQA